MAITTYRSSNAALFSIFALSGSYLQSRYYESAAFGKYLPTYMYLLGRQCYVLDTHRSSVALSPFLSHFLCYRPQQSFLLLVGCIVTRVLLNWGVTRMIHCSVDGVHAFLPFLLVLSARHNLHPSVILGKGDGNAASRLPILRYALLALVWGVAVSDLVSPPGNTTGAICPVGMLLERSTPLAQAVVLVLDVVIVYLIGSFRQSNFDHPSLVWRHFGSAFFIGAVAISFVCWWSYFDPTNGGLNLALSRLEARDIALDSMGAVLTLTSGFALLATFPADLVTIAAATMAVLFFAISRVLGSMVPTAVTILGTKGTGLITIAGFATWFKLSESKSAAPQPPHGDFAISRSQFHIMASAAFLVLIFRAFFPCEGDGPVLTPGGVMMAGQHESDRWMDMASKSTSLETAVDEYRSRYRIPPPPNFDKWYEFAISVNSPIIDVFDQINFDLLPFWGMPPAAIREKTAHLLEHPSLFVGGLLLKDGKMSISPHIRGTHKWMMDAVVEMVQPFSQYIPDMHLAFNLDDECRVAVPRETMDHLGEEAQAARMRATSKSEFLPFSQTVNPAWSTGFLDADEIIWDSWPDTFEVWKKKPIFNEVISPTCHPDAPARKKGWWNKKVWCGGCATPHLEDGFVRNWTLSGDLCHQPDLAHLHGFVQAPSALTATPSLSPVFSQAKMHSFSDIMYPSPWNFVEKARYDEDKDVLPWRHKLNDVYWRGTSSDGYAIRGSWQTFLRARFVHIASQVRAKTTVKGRDIMRCITGRRCALSQFPKPPSPYARISEANDSNKESQTIWLEQGNTSDLSDLEPITLNISFVDNFSRCEQRECASENLTFYSDTRSPSSLDFQESWQHRHLVDLDGAGFSGRFLPFLNSSSLPYRAALFRTWWEERVHPWRHYVPLDLRLHDFCPAVSYFGGAIGSEGSRHGEEIARRGSEWARKALRKEDMQVYMFRLLLEWGRLVDDERERLGFAVP
ncbi:glycosyltransferase family 90 protein [Xylariaceae sp. FL0594]|nr:glycosyltransferase family 90 protein [Xylariaceae sp. FL0594]